MPKWTVHIAFGTIISMGIAGVYIMFGPVDRFAPSVVGLIVAVFASILGSDFPDFDTRTSKIKYVLGFLVGGFISIMYLVHVHMDIRPLWEMFADWKTFYSGYLLMAFLLFVLFVLFNTLLWFFPLRHRGRAHSVVACVLYGVFWGSVGLVLMGLTLLDGLIITMMGAAGYLSHLLLDLDIKLWK